MKSFDPASQTNQKEWDFPGFPREEGEKRHARLREAMERNNLSCVVVAANLGNYGERSGNFRWLTNYAPWYGEEYLLFPQHGEPLLLTGTEGHADWARRITWIRRVETVTRSHPAYWDWARQIADYVKEIKAERSRIGICDDQTMPAYIYNDLCKELPNADMVDVRDLFTQLRIVKSELEIEFQEKAAACGDAGVRAMVAAAKPGVPEKQVWAACEYAMTVAGALPPSFSLIASCESFENKGISLPNAGSRRVLKPGDIILNELSPSYGGYWIQICAPIVLGKPSDSFWRHFNLHKDIYDLTLREIRPGVTVGEVNNKVREFAVSRGCDSAWSLQLIGVIISERIPGNTVLQPNMTFMVHAVTSHHGPQGRYGGVIIGNTVVITPTGHKTLSTIPIQMHVV